MSHDVKWCRLSLPWVPVAVTLGAEAAEPDPLSQAVLDLVRAGRTHPEALASTLCLHAGRRALLDSAMDELVERGLLVQDGDRLVAAPSAAVAEHSVERGGWLLWGWGRPVPMLWLGDRPELDDSRWDEDVSTEVEVPFPRQSEIEQVAPIFAKLSSLLVFESRGSPWVTSESGAVRGGSTSWVTCDRDLVRRVRPRQARWRRHPAYVRIAFGPTAKPTVWTPSMVPTAAVLTELDAGGWEAFLDRSDPASRQRLRHLEIEARSSLAPVLLSKAGYTSLDDLRQAATAQVRRELGTAWDRMGWRELRNLATDAEVSAIGAVALGGNWRAVLHGWADLLEATSRGLLDSVDLDAVLARVKEMHRIHKKSGSHDDNALRSVAACSVTLGGSTEILQDTIRSAQRLKELADALGSGVATIGTRLLAAAFAYALIPGGREALGPALQHQPGFFGELGAANKERTVVVHPEHNEKVDVSVFRSRVLALCGAVMRLSKRASSAPAANHLASTAAGGEAGHS